MELWAKKKRVSMNAMNAFELFVFPLKPHLIRAQKIAKIARIGTFSLNYYN
jgi:hypothetical protein